MTKSINEEQYKELTWRERLNYVKEFKCRCNECGKTWNYLANAEKEMKTQMLGNACVHAGNCCNPCIALGASNANTQLSKQIKELKQCPKCRSSNVVYEARYFPKQK